MSTFGTTVSPYGSWLNLTRATRVYGPDKLINDAAKNTYFIAEMIKNRPTDHVIRGGKFIEEPIILNDLGTHRAFTPGEVRSPTRTNFNYMLNRPWRFYEDHYTYTDAEIELNQGSDFEKFKNFDNAMRIALYTTMWNGMEGDIWKKPDKANMEDGSTSATNPSTPGLAYSIPTFICEGATAAARTGIVPPANNGTFTLLQGLDPSLYTNYCNQVAAYDSSNPGDSTTGLFSAFEEMMLKVDFKTVPGFSKYQETDDLRKLKISTSSGGRKLFSRLLAANNDQTRSGPQDPSYGMPQWAGIPIYYAQQLDTELLEQNPIGTYTTAAYPATRPRFFFTNLKYLFPVFHGKHMMEEKPPQNGGSLQYDAWVVYLVNWWNLICTSRRRQGIVRPDIS